MMVQHTSASATSSADDPSIQDQDCAIGLPPPPCLLSILCKPATFFDAPIRLLDDVEKHHLCNENESSPPRPPPFKIIIASEVALSAIAGFNIARGAMACGAVPTYFQKYGYAWLKGLLCGQSAKLQSKRTTAQSSQTSQQKPIRRIIALDATSNAANLGSILRTAAAFAIDAIILSDDSCDVWYRQSVRVSMGHAINVPTMRVADWERGRVAIEGDLGRVDEEEAKHDNEGSRENNGGLARVIRWLRTQMGVECLAAVVDDGNEKLKKLPPLVTLETNDAFSDRNRSWCCVLGNEGTGIRDGVVLECDKRIKIGMAQGVDSLSLPIAAGIIVHGLCSKTARYE